MVNKNSKVTIVPVRISDEERQIILNAAVLGGETMAGFIRRAALNQANRMLSNAYGAYDGA